VGSPEQLEAEVVAMIDGAALTVACPLCRAEPGQRCRAVLAAAHGGTELQLSHVARRAAARPLPEQ
jgi:hypothetical protein